VGSRLIVLAGPSEREYLRPLLSAFGAADDIEKGPVICPATTVGQMMALLSRTNLLVCNDSAPLHIAVGFGRPLVTIFGPTDPALVGPYQRDETVVRPPGQERVPPRLHRHLRDDQSLIGQVPVDAVWEKIQEQLRSPRASATP
jgi:heptosyltransferase-1